jgi:hypothetical protein
MTTYVFRDGEVVDKATAAPLFESSPGPHVISDTMPETRHMATNRYFTSKSAFRQETKAAGCVEVGNDPAVSRPRKPVQLDRGKRREAIKRTLYELRNR